MGCCCCKNKPLFQPKPTLGDLDSGIFDYDILNESVVPDLCPLCGEIIVNRDALCKCMYTPSPPVSIRPTLKAICPDCKSPYTRRGLLSVGEISCNCLANIYLSPPRK